MGMVYFGIWLLGMKVFDLQPVTSAQAVGGLMVVHLVLRVLSDWDFSGGGRSDYQADINQPFNFGGTVPRFDFEDDDHQSNDHFFQSMEDDRIAEQARADHEYWVWENPHLEELERDGKD